jgi:hypothetical protein
MKLRDIGRVMGLLGAVLTFFVGIVSVVLGLASSSPEQSGGSLVVRGLILLVLAAVASYGVSFGSRRPVVTSIYLVTVALLGTVTAFRSFWMAAAALVIAAVIYYSNRES